MCDPHLPSPLSLSSSGQLKWNEIARNLSVEFKDNKDDDEGA